MTGEKIEYFSLPIMLVGNLPPLPLKEKNPQDRIKNIEYSHIFRERPLEYSILSILCMPVQKKLALLRCYKVTTVKWRYTNKFSFRIYRMLPLFLLSFTMVLLGGTMVLLRFAMGLLGSTMMLLAFTRVPLETRDYLKQPKCLTDWLWTENKNNTCWNGNLAHSNCIRWTGFKQKNVCIYIYIWLNKVFVLHILWLSIDFFLLVMGSFFWANYLRSPHLYNMIFFFFCISWHVLIDHVFFKFTCIFCIFADMEDTGFVNFGFLEVSWLNK